jgi:hypothetical protein
MSRQWISVLAVLGMLLHAAVTVRHHSMMIGVTLASGAAAIEQQIDGEAKSALAMVFGSGAVICHSDSKSSPRGHGDQESGGQKSGPVCQLCLTAAAAQAVVPLDQAIDVAISTLSTGFFANSDQRVETIRKLRPPSRAPPPSLV